MPNKPDSPLGDLYKSLSGKGAMPLDPDDPYYVPILQATPERDPILMLWQRLDVRHPPPASGGDPPVRG